MNKSRIEAFSDAVVAIILTIMILEFKTPESLKFGAILEQWPYLLSYGIGYLFIGVAWYNHHYIFSKAKIITQKIYWLNLLWLFATSFLPVGTAWVSEGLNAFGPELFYAFIYTLWGTSYMLLSKAVWKDNTAAGYGESVAMIPEMFIYKTLTNWPYMVFRLVILALVLWLIPIMVLFLMLFDIIFWGARFNSDSDKLFT